eukprot:7447272-Alexandrium_andersonii.AAC.1
MGLPKDSPAGLLDAKVVGLLAKLRCSYTLSVLAELLGQSSSATAWSLTAAQHARFHEVFPAAPGNRQHNLADKLY